MSETKNQSKLFDSKSETMHIKSTTRKFWSWKTWSIISFLTTGIYIYLFFFTEEIFPQDDSFPIWAKIIFSVFSGSFAGTFLYGFYCVFRKAIFFVNRPFEVLKIESETEKLQEELETDFFTNLIKINFKYLDKYYLQTQVQADKSFMLSAIAAVIGLLIVILGIILMFFNKTTPAYVTTAAGIISEMIAAVFFYLYNKTIVKMSEYHQKLVLTQNIGLSLKIAEALPENERVKAQQLLVKELTSNVNYYLTTNLIADIKKENISKKRISKA